MGYSGDKNKRDAHRRGATPSETPADDSYLNTDGSATESTGATTDSPPETTDDGEAGRSAGSGASTAESAADARASGDQRALDEQREKYLRLQADFDNYRKRSTRERAEAGSRAQGDLVKQIVDALDDLGRFAHLDPQSVDSATVVQGVEMVERKLLKSLGAAGLTVVNPIDQPFDPALHEAVATEPALSSEDDHMVARVYQLGYVFNGQLLRPARVVVKQWS